MSAGQNQNPLFEGNVARRQGAEQEAFGQVAGLVDYESLFLMPGGIISTETVLAARSSMS